MTKSNFFLAFAIFAFCACFAFSFTSAGPNWLWQDRTEVPFIFGGLSLLALIAFFLQKRQARKSRSTITTK